MNRIRNAVYSIRQNMMALCWFVTHPAGIVTILSLIGLGLLIWWGESGR